MHPPVNNPGLATWRRALALFICGGIGCATVAGLPLQRAAAQGATPAPVATALPQEPGAVRIERRQRLSLAEALAVAVRNDPDLAAAVLSVREQQDLAGSARGRWWPELGLNLAGGFRQQRSYSQVWAGNDGIYPSGSPFLVSPQGWNVVQTNVGAAAARMELGWELISP